MLSGLLSGGGFGEYFSPEGMTLRDIAARVKAGDKPYTVEVMFPVDELWSIRDYSWTAENLRPGSVPLGPPDEKGCPRNYLPHSLAGAERWYALKSWMKLYGWRCDPAHVFVGKDGRVKLGEGNHRVAIARELGIKMVPVIFWQRQTVSRTSEQAMEPRQLAGLKTTVPSSALDYAARKLDAKMKRCGVTKAELRTGMKVELEHKDVTKGGIEKTARIALAHLCERRDYYRRLKKYVENAPVNLSGVTHADTVYRNADDTMRARVFKRGGRGTWDFDLFDRARDDIQNFSSKDATLFQKKTEVLAHLRSEYGITQKIDTGSNWTRD